MNRYASEVDVDFVRKAVKAIGQTAIKIESAAGRCVQLLLDLIQTRVSYVVQEAIVVIKVSSGGPFSFSLSKLISFRFRTSSVNTHTATKESSPSYAQISMSWMNQKQRLR